MSGSPVVDGLVVVAMSASDDDGWVVRCHLEPGCRFISPTPRLTPGEATLDGLEHAATDHPDLLS